MKSILQCSIIGTLVFGLSSLVYGEEKGDKAVAELVTQLGGTKEEANKAYKALYKKGKEVIPVLLAAKAQDAKYKGDCHIDILSSSFLKGLRVQTLRLYLIDAILRQELSPYQSPLLCFRYGKGKPEMAINSAVSVREATLLYQAWWKKDGNRILKGEISFALDGTKYYWDGSYRVQKGG